ncbi:DUF2894 domain-containing protein [Acidovorax sp. JHL-9]|uniref:DUF2894 domain-containing protein n=1 Tax=Acidovorax sp. JHL-9 TaxID=1276756 RepID=UPI0004173DE2|nr:DUF2894 domain-containing protein [Acidovorax sp. JHL-9]
MSEPGEPTRESLQSLRACGADRHDPARFHFLEVMARRIPGQPAAVQQVLQGRLRAAVADYAACVRSMPGQRPRREQPAIPAEGSALVQLNRDLNARVRNDGGIARMGDGAGVSDMKSVRQFSEVWSKISAERRVAQALEHGPDNAGPLNSHKLMLRALCLMQSLSPDYLRRFLSHADSLLWLEQASAKPSRLAAKPGRKGQPRQ